MKSFALIVIVIFNVVSTRAATITAASASRTDVNTAIQAGRNNTVLVTNLGTVTWSSPIVITTGVIITGPGAGSLTIVGGSGHFTVNPDATAIANEERIEIAGFKFDGNNTAAHHIDGTGAGPTDTKPFKNLVIRNNGFFNSSPTTSGQGVIDTIGQFRGVISSNEFNRCNVIAKILGNDDTREWTNNAFRLFAYGSSDSLFFEDNYIHYTSTGSWADPGWIETGQGSRLVGRYNTWNLANATQQELWDIHGFQNWNGTPNSGQTGTMITEYYGNTASNCGGYRWVNHRGSWALIFDNIITGTGAMDNNINGMSPNGHCASDISPSPSGIYTPEVNNSYFTGNTLNGIEVLATLDLAGCSVTENSSWYNYNSSFNGTTGVGRGTSAPGGNATTGVGYLQQSPATPTTSKSVIQASIFWKATAPNTWTAYYTPFTYPHPLLGASATPGTLALGASTYSIAENGGSLQVTVTRTGGSSGAVGISYATANGTATAGSDYTTTSGTLSWANGDTATKTISIPILDDAIVEASETFNLSLSGATGGSTLGSPNSATITITDNDTLPPAISVSPSTAQTFTDTDVNQSRTLSFTVSNTGGGTLSGSVSGLSAPFSIVSGSPYSIGGGGNQVITIRFSPTAVGAFSQTAAFSGGAGASRGLTGTGLAVNSTVLSGVAAAGPVSFNQ